MSRSPWWLVIGVVLAVGPSAPAGAQASYDLIRIVAPAAPGGGWDQTARAMQTALQQAGLVRSVSVENIPGAAGTIGLARFVGAERGNGNALMVSGLIMLGGIVSHRSPVTLRDVAPIARLTGEYEVIVVPAGSPFRSLADLIAALRARPESVSWGGGSAGGSDQMLAGLLADAVGVQPRRVNYIAFSGGGESLSAIVGGQVSVGLNGLAELLPQIEAGTVRALGVSSADRIPGVEVPTLREQGVDVVFENWRSLVAPPGVSATDRRRLEGVVESLVRSQPWRDALQRYRWLDRYLSGEAFERFLTDEEARVQRILRELGTRAGDADPQSSIGAYPRVVLIGLVLCGLGALVGGRRARGAEIAQQAAGTNRGAHVATRNAVGRGAIGWLAAGVLLHIALVERGGFVVASAVLFWCAARAFDARHPLRDALGAAVVSVAAYLLFARVLDLQLPAGILTGWL